MKILISGLVLLLLLFFPSGLENTDKNTGIDPVVEVSFNFVGDLMVHSVQRQYACEDSIYKIYNFNPSFSEISEILSSADFTAGNLETVVSDSIPFSGYPRFNAPKQFLSALKNAGFDMLYVANNHMQDHGSEGIEQTIENIRSEGIFPSGFRENGDTSRNVQIMNVKGIKTAFLAYTYGTNLGYSKKNAKYRVNRIDSAAIVNDIKTADENGAELITVYFHFGNEYERKENKFQRKIEKIAKSAGADIILASHPHVLQPVEIYASEKGRIDSGFTVYSMGNFISNQRWRYSDCGVVINFSVIKDLITGKLRLKEVKYLPVWVYKGNTGDGYRFVVIPKISGHKKDYPGYLTEDDFKLMQQSFDDTEKILTKYTGRIKQYKISGKRKNNLAAGYNNF